MSHLVVNPRGLLLCYNILRVADTSGLTFNYMHFIGKRWLKLSTPLSAALLIYYLLPLIGSGPVWHECDQYFQPGCRDWTVILSNFLYYSNFNILNAKHLLGIVCHFWYTRGHSISTYSRERVNQSPMYWVVKGYIIEKNLYLLIEWPISTSIYRKVWNTLYLSI